jgi:hypothetical protein
LVTQFDSYIGTGQHKAEQEKRVNVMRSLEKLDVFRSWHIGRTAQQR